MKKIFTIILCIVMICSVTGCAIIFDPHIPNGYMSSEEYWDEEGFQDYTDFCIYHYDSVDSFVNRPGYHMVEDDELEKLVGYFADFRQWMELEERLDEYSFEESCISAGDFCYIKTREGENIGSDEYGPYDSYSVYFFDVETLTLYYIHNDI